MVDLGMTGNYINLGFIKKLGLLEKAKAVPKLITGLNGENLETLSIITKSGTILIVMLGHIKCLNFNIISIG
jgi:hypothetical protein